MIVARICKSPHLNLKGVGAKLYGGRWNSPGKPVVYAASCGALAALEYRAHVKGALPTDLFLLWIEIPDTLAIEEVKFVPADTTLFPRLGDEWLRKGEKPLLRVQSVLVPKQWNLLINPEHPTPVLSKSKSNRRSRLTRDFSLRSSLWVQPWRAVAHTRSVKSEANAILTR